MGMVEIYYLIWWISIHKTAILGYDSGTTSAPTSSGEKDLESSWTVRTIWSGRLLVEGQPLQLKANWYLWDCHHHHHHRYQHHHQRIYQSGCGLCLSIPEGFSLVRDYLPHKVWVVRVSTITLWPPGGVLDRSPSNSSYGLIVPRSGSALLNPGFTQETKQQGGWKDLPPATRSCSALCLQPAVVLCPLFWFHILRSGDIDLWRTCIFRCFVYPAKCK